MNINQLIAKLQKFPGTAQVLVSPDGGETLFAIDGIDDGSYKDGEYRSNYMEDPPRKVNSILVMVDHK